MWIQFDDGSLFPSSIIVHEGLFKNTRTGKYLWKSAVTGRWYISDNIGPRLNSSWYLMPSQTKQVWGTTGTYFPTVWERESDFVYVSASTETAIDDTLFQYVTGYYTVANIANPFPGYTPDPIVGSSWTPRFYMNIFYTSSTLINASWTRHNATTGSFATSLTYPTNWSDTFYGEYQSVSAGYIVGWKKLASTDGRYYYEVNIPGTFDESSRIYYETDKELYLWKDELGFWICSPEIDVKDLMVGYWKGGNTTVLGLYVFQHDISIPIEPDFTLTLNSYVGDQKFPNEKKLSLYIGIGRIASALQYIETLFTNTIIPLIGKLCPSWDVPLTNMGNYAKIKMMTWNGLLSTFLSRFNSTFIVFGQSPSSVHALNPSLVPGCVSLTIEESCRLAGTDVFLPDIETVGIITDEGQPEELFANMLLSLNQTTHMLGMNGSGASNKPATWQYAPIGYVMRKYYHGHFHCLQAPHGAPGTETSEIIFNRMLSDIGYPMRNTLTSSKIVAGSNTDLDYAKANALACYNSGKGATDGMYLQGRITSPVFVCEGYNEGSLSHGWDGVVASSDCFFTYYEGGIDLYNHNSFEITAHVYKNRARRNKQHRNFGSAWVVDINTDVYYSSPIYLGSVTIAPMSHSMFLFSELNLGDPSTVFGGTPGLNDIAGNQDYAAVYAYVIFERSFD